MSKVLVTGITGFAGLHLAQLLLKDSSKELYGTYNSEGSDKKLAEHGGKITLHKVDLTKKNEVDELVQSVQPDEVYHLAAQTSPSESFKDPAATFSTNTLSQFYLLDALAKQTNSPKVITVSSSEIYGSVSASDLPVDEETEFKPLSPYSVSKITQDYLSYYFFLVNKLNVIRVRPFNHTGPGQEKFVVPSFARQIAQIEKGEIDPILKVGNLAAKKDFSDVRDIVRAYTLLMEKGVSGDVYNVGSGKSVQIQTILDTFLSLTDKEIKVAVDQSLFRPVDVEDIYADHSKLTKDTGWEPQIELETTLKDVLDYFRKVV